MVQASGCGWLVSLLLHLSQNLKSWVPRLREGKRKGRGCVAPEWSHGAVRNSGGTQVACACGNGSGPGPSISRSCHLILSPKEEGCGQACNAGSLQAEERPAGLSAQGPGCAPLDTVTVYPSELPPTSVKLKPYTLGAVHPPRP